MRSRGSRVAIVLAVTTAISIAACAKAIDDPASDVTPPPGGDDSGTQPPSGDDSSSPVTPGDDSGSGQLDTGVDSASPTPGDDSGTSTPDSSPVVTDSGSSGQDTGPPPTWPSICPNTKKYKTEFNNIPLFTAVICTDGSECTQQECCFAASAFGLNTSACVAL